MTDTTKNHSINPKETRNVAKALRPGVAETHRFRRAAYRTPIIDGWAVHPDSGCSKYLKVALSITSRS
jgi:hypothetical protein